MTNAHARFSIGIDLGTTNSALAFAPLVGEGTPEILFVPQWESLAGLTEEPTLPSFLYLPEEAAAAYFRGREVGAGQWVVGRFARIKASETPGRVVHSAKSWLCHHAADRSARVSALGIDRSGARAEDLTGTRLCTDSELSAGDLEQPVCPGRVCV